MADLKITITIPEANQKRIKDAINALLGNQASLSVFLEKKGLMSYDFSFSKQDKNESDADFYKRFFTEIVKMYVGCYEMANDKERYVNQIKSIDPPNVDVPNQIIT